MHAGTICYAVTGTDVALLAQLRLQKSLFTAGMSGLVGT